MRNMCRCLRLIVVFVVTFILSGCLDEVENASHDVTSPNPVVNELLSHLRTLQVGPYDFKDMRWSDMVGKITDDARRALRETGFKYSFGFSGGPGIREPQKEIGSLHIPRTSPYEAFRLVAERFDGKIWYGVSVPRLIISVAVCLKLCLRACISLY